MSSTIGYQNQRSTAMEGASLLAPFVSDGSIGADSGSNRPICIDLFCGLGGWTEGFLAEGYTCIGFDIERHEYGTGGYPGHLVLQDIRTVHGSQFRDAAVIVASPPCQKYSYMAMPWSRAKKIRAEYLSGERSVDELNELFKTCLRIKREACEAAGRYIPLIIENVRGAEEWVGPADWKFGSYYLWGDIPALMPSAAQLKVRGVNFHAYENGLGSSPSFNGATHETRHVKTQGHVNKRDGHTHTRHLTNQRESDAIREGCKGAGAGAGWFDNNLCVLSSKSDSRKAASAHIAKIPFALARHIARTYKPVLSLESSR